VSRVFLIKFNLVYCSVRVARKYTFNHHNSEM